MSYSPRTVSGTNTAKSYGAIGDGSSHQLSSLYGTLGAAQAAYPNASITALTQQIDRAAIQQMFHDLEGKAMVIEPGTYLIDVMLVMNPAGTQGGTLTGAGGTGGNNGTILKCLPGANLAKLFQLHGQNVKVDSVTLDGAQYTGSFSNLTQATQGTPGCVYGWWFQNCANSYFSFLGANNFSGFGFYFDSTGGISDGVTLMKPCAQGNGCAEVQSLVSTATGGTFTLTVSTNLGTQTTGAIAYNASYTTVLGALNALSTVAPSGDQGGATCFTTGGPGLPANTIGPLGTHPVYVLMRGPMNAPQNLLTVNTGGLSGGTVTCTRIQAGITGGGFGWGSGTDGNIVCMIQPRASENVGDGIFQQEFAGFILNADLENNGCCGWRTSGAGSTTVDGNALVWPYTEGNWQSLYADNLTGTGGTANLVFHGDHPSQNGSGNLLRQGSGNLEMDVKFGQVATFNSNYATISTFFSSPIQIGAQTTGGGSASLGSNSPASTPGAPHTWIEFHATDGSIVYVPAWA